MAEDIQYHLDENVDPDVASGLRRHGIDVTTTFEHGLQGQSDIAQWEFVSANRRVMMTHDADFLRLADRNENHLGIVYCAKGTRSIGDIIRSLILIYEVISAAEMRGRIEFI